MAKINLLDKSVFELIAAGEVIERPASVIKELAENAIDAGAKHITVEIKNGGSTFMRVTDDGCGIAHEEIPTAFLRHATSKVNSAADLDRIFTLGFRGEALASVAAVAKVELLTKEADKDMGSSFKISGGEVTEHERMGCPNGTTIIIRDLFFNVPARRKFLKKDVTEGNQVQALVDKLALSHPDIAFRFIRDNKPVRDTSGDGDYYSAIYAVFGRQFAVSLIPVDFSLNGVSVTGYVSSPLFTRANRALQYFYINGRPVRSIVLMTALEEGFRNSIMTGKFPACVLNVTLSPELCDVNVSPSKTEVRFAYEKNVFDAVHFGVKNAILNADSGRKITLEKKEIPTEKPQPTVSDRAFLDKAVKAVESVPFEAENTAKPEQTEEPPRVFTMTKSKPLYFSSPKSAELEISPNTPGFVQQRFNEPSKRSVIAEYDDDDPDINEKDGKGENKTGFAFLNALSFAKSAEGKEETPEEKTEVSEPIITAEEPTVPVKVIGEIFATYIICQHGDEMVLIDKHAAHERIRFEKRRKELITSSQLLAECEEVTLTAEQYSAVAEHKELLDDIGLDIILLDGMKCEITASPSAFSGGKDTVRPSDILIRAADLLVNGNTNVIDEIYDDLQHSRACKSAIKAHDVNSTAELQVLADEVFADERIRFCPHGRPVMVKLSQYEIEKYFSRIV